MSTFLTRGPMGSRSRPLADVYREIIDQCEDTPASAPLKAEAERALAELLERES